MPAHQHVVAGALGSSMRLGRCPQPDPDALVDFVIFVKNLIVCKLALRPVPGDADTSPAAWFPKTSYNQADQERLSSRWMPVSVVLDLARRWTHLPKDRPIPLEFEIFVVSLFFKWEFYPEPKHFRSINARDDAFKIFFGPYEHLLSDILYHATDSSGMCYFVKLIPVDMRAEYIDYMMYRIGNEFMGTDHSSFEAIFTKPVMFATTMQLYEYMFKLLPEGAAVCEILQRVLAGKQFIKSKFFTMVMDAIRCSGEMDTSSANGFSNLCFFLYAMYLINLEQLQLDWLAQRVPARRVAVQTISGLVETDVAWENNPRGVVEGDDGLGTAAGRLPGPTEFARLGCSVKEDRSDDPLSMAFCGIIAVRNRDGSLTNIKEPLKVLAKFPWLPNKFNGAKPHFKMTLYRARAYSLLVEMRNNPMTHNFALAVLRLTKSCHNRLHKALQAFDRYHRVMVARGIEEFGADVPKPAITPEVRMAVSDSFRISIAEQIKIEQDFDKAKTLGELFSPTLFDLFPPKWVEHHDRFVSRNSWLPPSGLQAHQGNLRHVARLSSLFDVAHNDITRYELFVKMCRYSGLTAVSEHEYTTIVREENDAHVIHREDHAGFWAFLRTRPDIVVIRDE